jgi:hypothetical protein
LLIKPPEKQLDIPAHLLVGHHGTLAGTRSLVSGCIMHGVMSHSIGPQSLSTNAGETGKLFLHGPLPLAA